MGNEEMTVSWRTLVQMACARAAETEMEALPTPEGLLALYPDMAAADRRVLSAVEAARRANRKGKRPALRTIRRVLIAAAVAVCAFFCIAMTNPAVQNAVTRIVTEWTKRDVCIRFQVSGETLSALPAGYGPHYIPEGLVLDEENSWQQSDGSLFYNYTNADGSQYLSIQVIIAQNGSAYWIDREHIKHEKITFNDVDAYYGYGTSLSGDKVKTLLWAKDGVEHSIYTNVPVSEMFKFAENIY